MPLRARAINSRSKRKGSPLSFTISNADRDIATLNTSDDVKRFMNPENPRAVKVSATKVNDGRGGSFKIREDK